MKCLARVSNPKVVWRADSGPSGTRSFSFSRQVLSWARLKIKQEKSMPRVLHHDRHARRGHANGGFMLDCSTEFFGTTPCWFPTRNSLLKGPLLEQKATEERVRGKEK